MNQEIILIIMGVFLVVVVFAYTLKRISPISPFLYSNARIQARRASLVSEQKFSEMAEASSLRQLSSQLMDSAYGKELEKMPEKLELFHLALEKSFVDSVAELIDLSPKKAKTIFNAYLMFMESKMLKTIYRVKFSKLKINEELIFPIGIVHDGLLKRLIEAETVADLSVVMEPTVYKELFSKKYETLEEFDIALDGFVLNNFIAIVKKTKMYEAKLIIEIVNAKVDILNLIALLKFRIRGIEKEKRLKLLINNNTLLSARFNQLIEAIEAETLQGFVNICKETPETPYFKPLTIALEKYEKDKALSHFENELYKFHKKSVVDIELYHTLGPYPLFSYLIKREAELRNLFVISRGIDAKFPPEKIRSMII